MVSLDLKFGARNSKIFTCRLLVEAKRVMSDRVGGLHPLEIRFISGRFLPTLPLLLSLWLLLVAAANLTAADGWNG